MRRGTRVLPLRPFLFVDAPRRDVDPLLVDPLLAAYWQFFRTFMRGFNWLVAQQIGGVD